MRDKVLQELRAIGIQLRAEDLEKIDRFKQVRDNQQETFSWMGTDANQKKFRVDFLGNDKFKAHRIGFVLPDDDENPFFEPPRAA